MVIQGKFLGMVMREIRDKLFKEEREGYIIFEKKRSFKQGTVLCSRSLFWKICKAYLDTCHFHLSTQEYKNLNLPFYCRFQFVSRWSFDYFPC